MTHLYIFDLDGTLIKSFLDEVVCPRCHGSGKVYQEGVLEPSRWADDETCRGTGWKLVHAEQTYDEIIWLPGRLELLARLRDAGQHVAIATNQTGVGLGYQTREQVDAKLAAVTRTIAELKPIVSMQPHAWVTYDVKETERRKPAPGMLNEAMAYYDSPRHATTFVGDLPVDQQAAEAARVPFAWADAFFS